MAASTPGGILKKSIPERNRIHRRNDKKGRLIVRNLSFKVSNSQLKDIFTNYGNVVEVNIPTKSDGKKRGFAFVQYENTKDAIKAINGLNSKLINNRPVAVDFAVCKSIYEAQINQSELEVVDDDFKLPAKNSLADSDGEENKDSGVDSAKDNSRSDGELESNSESSEGEIDDTDDEADDDSQMNIDSEHDSDMDGSTKKSQPKESRKRPSDVVDGQTLFLRNLPFQAQEDDLEELMEEFGDVTYAVFCHDPVTELPKGTGFVRFSEKESAQKCLDKANDESKGGLVLDGRRLNVSLALAREEAQKISRKDKNQGKDKRNLYLSREGLIRIGTQAAEGVSKTDMALRARLEYRKRNALRNLQFFVSQTRLCVHNLPPSFDNKQLKNLFLKAADDKTARVIEARVMRNQNGLGKSKGFGFVEFMEHEHALATLRKLNNNPNVFTAQKRPIVEFSIENRNAINAKLKRQAKLQSEKSLNQKTVKENKRKGASQRQVHQRNVESSDKNSTFSGFRSRKDVKNLPSHFGPKVRHKKSAIEKIKNKKEVLKTDFTDSKSTEEKLKKTKTKKKTQKSKAEKKDIREERDFQALVSKYKGTLSDVSDVQKQKWYEDD